MRPILKPNVKATLRELRVGQVVEFGMDSVSENSVRSGASKVKAETGAAFTVTRSYPHFKVTRTA